MNWLDYVNMAASVATAIGVIVAAWQIILTKQQARVQFEDDLVSQYREIIRYIPVEALLGEELNGEEYRSTLDDIYRYIDLSNQQIFLRQSGRVGKKTWASWQSGIKSHLQRPTFKKAWEDVKFRSKKSFAELRLLEAKNFESDPLFWGKEEEQEILRVNSDNEE